MNATLDDRELERRLRATLDGRADTVTSGPDWQQDGDHRPVQGVRHARRWLAPLAAAAAVAAVVASVVAIEDGSSGHHTPPATQVPSGTGAPSPTTPLVPRPIERAACMSALPPSWRDAISQGTQVYGAQAANPLAASGDGRLLVSRDYGHQRDVALVSSTGTAHSIYSVPQPDQNQVLRATLEGNWALLNLERQPRSSNEVLATDRQVVLVDVRTGATTSIARVSMAQYRGARHVVDGATLYQGTVYYDVRPRYGSNSGAVHAYDIGTGHDRVVFTGQVGYGGPELVAGGVSWTTDAAGTPQVSVPRHVPDRVSEQLRTAKQAGSLLTDGRSYAWQASADSVGWWQPGQSRATVITLPGRANADLVGIAGPYLLLGSITTATGTSLLDARSGAVADAAPVQPYSVSSPGLLAAYGFLGRFKESATAVVRIDTAGLPALHC